MKNIAIITGGPSSEREIALLGAELVRSHINTQQYLQRTIVIEPEGWVDTSSGEMVDLNTFSLTVANERIQFDFAFLMIHGTPAEDGKLQGYFESKGIPHSTCNTLTCALTFNKQWCKDFLKSYDVTMARSFSVNKRHLAEALDVSLNYPVFVKPNNNGSSYGISRVTEREGLRAALEHAAEYDDDIMIEEEISGREFSCGVIKTGGDIHTFPLTEIIPDGDFFDYAAKYEGAGREVTPADLPDELTIKCHTESERLYRILQCRGIVRFDYILHNDTFYLLEVNTVPGMSEASIVPQQVRAYGWSIDKLIETVIEECGSQSD